ncbi:GNAT family N-acetyltransferase (plasmid) [Alloyangia pacifica]|uniref:GNAT family N-acetyltransferase n=1 Tax=Alloyangia pacifica TaxID=311180 RepID=A0A2U8HJ03_9RHOB|nr:GNAT family N-acetyltransferase [Alloyangia pacifica]AWI85917.1 GNAT family N-acetyltransferase [Alloyangia pacifica]
MTRVDTPSPAPSAVDIVGFEPAHLEGAQALSTAVGWAHRVEDWALNLSVSRGVIGLADGRVVATALCSLHGPVATLNMIIVDGSMRGRGLGRKVMEAAMALAEDREMRLVATPEGMPLYRKLGFLENGRIVQMGGTARAATPECDVQVGSVNPQRLAKMDFAASGMERGALLTRIAEAGETLSADGGFAMLRRFGRGHVLGPIVARNPATARALIAAAATRMEGQPLRIDVYEDLGLVPFIEELGLAIAGTGTPMVRAAKAHPESDYRTHALVSQALG